MTDVVSVVRNEIEVDGRVARVLRSGRAVWKDDDAEIFGAWFAERFPTPQYLVTFTHDPEKTAVRRLRARGVPQPSARDVVNESARAMTHEVLASLVKRWMGHVSRGAQAPVYAVGGTESFKSGDAHAHLALSIGDERRDGHIRLMWSKWFDLYGYISCEEPRSVHDIVTYATKYVFKDISRGVWLMSRELEGRMKKGVVPLL